MNVTIRNGQCDHVKIYVYPDGQRNVALDMEWFDNPKDGIDIHCNVRDFEELELLLCIMAALRKHDFFIRSIKFNYLYGMRSDRSFETGMPNYMRDVLAPVIQGMNIPHIYIEMPHSEAATLSVNANDTIKCPSLEGYIAIGADESANERFDFMRTPDYFFHKTRSESGDISVTLKNEFYSKIETLPDHLPILIVDDLCDGGATFIAIAEYLKEHFPERKRHLYVCHGLFTKGVDHVAAHYDKIITTNSYQDFEPHPKLEIIDVWS